MSELGLVLRLFLVVVREGLVVLVAGVLLVVGVLVVGRTVVRTGGRTGATRLGVVGGGAAVVLDGTTTGGGGTTGTGEAAELTSVLIGAGGGRLLVDERVAHSSSPPASTTTQTSIQARLRFDGPLGSTVDTGAAGGGGGGPPQPGGRGPGAQPGGGPGTEPRGRPGPGPAGRPGPGRDGQPGGGGGRWPGWLFHLASGGMAKGPVDNPSSVFTGIAVVASRPRLSDAASSASAGVREPPRAFDSADSPADPDRSGDCGALPFPRPDAPSPLVRAPASGRLGPAGSGHDPRVSSIAIDCRPEVRVG
ncbi:MAG TPA: hypothetical protein VK735_48620 [Pseudonocardia sp.]|uniref:hypothetical protein n=1 Tax=Pseudonocardia sp. TaxID=60912 RepID=UPI002C49DEDE|nr:hypothetical protein [Pseudonocardia sp.]HTF55362.1 hypothetical protein [Pseudonocardia sp.]